MSYNIRYQGTDQKLYWNSERRDWLTQPDRDKATKFETRADAQTEASTLKNGYIDERLRVVDVAVDRKSCK